MTGSEDRTQTPIDDLDQLDAYIDARNAEQGGLLPDDDGLAALFDTVDRVRSLRATTLRGSDADHDFPERLVTNLERNLTPGAGRVTTQNHLDRSGGDALPAPSIHPAAHMPIPIRIHSRREWVRPAFQFVAAVFAFVLVAGILTAVLRGEGDLATRTGNSGDITNEVGVAVDSTPTSLEDAGTSVTSTTTTSSSTLESRPTPDENGRFTFTGWEQAAQVSAFDLQQPFNVPEPFVLLSITVERDPDLDGSDPSAFDWVNAWYIDKTASSQFASIHFTQTQRPPEQPAGEGLTSEEYLLDNTPIQKWTYPAKDVTYTEYRWAIGRVTNMVSAPIIGPITDPMLESFVASIQQSKDDPVGEPTPDASGAYAVASFAEAQELAGFDLWELEALPPGVTLDGIRLETELDLSTVTMTRGRVDNVASWYLVKSSQSGIRYSQWLRGCDAPGMEDAETSTLDIGGRQITRTLGTNVGGAQLADYRMEHDGVCLSVFAILNEVVTTELLESMVDLFPPPPASEGFTDATPTTEETTGFSVDFPVISVSPDYGACDATVMVSGSNFTPGTTVQFYGGGRLGDSFYLVAEAMLVDDLGSFLVETTVESIVSSCDVSAASDSVGFRVAASTVGGDAKAGVLADGPSATTVFTLSSDVPDMVRQRTRLLSCGTEEQFVEDGMRGPSGPNIDYRSCFTNALDAGQRAELVSYQSVGAGINYEFIATIFRANADGTITLLEDRTHDGSGAGGWILTTCDGLRTTADGLFEFDACVEEATDK